MSHKLIHAILVICLFTLAHSEDTIPMQKITPLVFIHGFKGATLASQSGKTYWITLTQALGLHTPNLALPLHWDRGCKPDNGIRLSLSLRFMHNCFVIYDKVF